jgi:hypothetical protein
LVAAGAVVNGGVPRGKVIARNRSRRPIRIFDNSSSWRNASSKAQGGTIRLKLGKIWRKAEFLLLNAEFQTVEGVRSVLTAESHSLNPESEGLEAEFRPVAAEWISLKVEKKSVAVESFSLELQYILLDRQKSYVSAESKILAFDCPNSASEQKRLNSQQISLSRN